MDPDPKNILAGFVVALSVMTLAMNIWWRRYGRYFHLFFPPPWSPRRQKILRVVLAFYFVGSILMVIEAFSSTSHELSDLGLSALYGCIMLATFFLMDAVVMWINSDR